MEVAVDLPDPALPEVRIEYSIAHAEVMLAQANRVTADLNSVLDHTLEEAREHPEVYVDPRLSPSS